MANTVFVFCEHGADGIRPVTFELIGKGRELGSVTAVSISPLSEGELQSLSEAGASRIIACGCTEPDVLTCIDALCSLIGKYTPDILLVGATAFGRSMAPGVAARLKTGLTADCTGLEIDPETGLLRQTRPAFGGNLMATIVCPDTKPQIATVRPKVFRALSFEGKAEVIREHVDVPKSPIELIKRELNKGDISIADADVLVSVGQGIGTQENIRLAEKLAEKLGGTLSASRPMIDNGILPYARQVGQTGRTVAPRLYIALGISGAVQHMAGVAAKHIIAVNTDPDAPIFAYADYAIRQDCGTFLHAILDKLN